MAEALGRLPVAVGLERGGQLGLRSLNQRQITASRQLEQIGIGSIGRYGLLVEAAVELELADRAVERSRRAGRKIPDRHRYGRCRQILAHLLHRLAAEEIVKKRLAVATRLNDDLCDDRHAALLDMQRTRLLRVKQHLFHDTGVVDLAVQRLPLPTVTVYVELLRPETVESRILDALYSAQLHPRIKFEGYPYGLPLVDIVPIDGHPQQDIVRSQLAAPSFGIRFLIRASGGSAALPRHRFARHHLDRQRPGRVGFAFDLYGCGRDGSQPLVLGLQDIGIGKRNRLADMAVDDRHGSPLRGRRAGQHVEPAECGRRKPVGLGIHRKLDPESLAHGHHARSADLEVDFLGPRRKGQRQQRRHRKQVFHRT